MCNSTYILFLTTLLESPECTQVILLNGVCTSKMGSYFFFLSETHSFGSDTWAFQGRTGSMYTYVVYLIQKAIWFSISLVWVTEWIEKILFSSPNSEMLMIAVALNCFCSDAFCEWTHSTLRGWHLLAPAFDSGASDAKRLSPVHGFKARTGSMQQLHCLRN